MTDDYTLGGALRPQLLIGGMRSTPASNVQTTMLGVMEIPSAHVLNSRVHVLKVHSSTDLLVWATANLPALAQVLRLFITFQAALASAHEMDTLSPLCTVRQPNRGYRLLTVSLLTDHNNTWYAANAYVTCALLTFI